MNRFIRDPLQANRYYWLMLLMVTVPAWAMPPVAWMRDPFYVVAENVGKDGVSGMFYPAGQSSANWQERIELRRLGPAGNRTLGDWMRQASSDYSRDCESFDSIAIPVSEPRPDEQLNVAWLCFQEKGLDRGRLALVRLLRSQDAVYLMIAGGRVSKYDKSHIPVLPEATDRWGASIAQFVACRDLTQLQCAPTQAIMGETPVIAATPAERAEIALASARGMAMYKQDHLAWYGTDFAVAHGQAPKREKGYGFVAVPGVGLSGTLYLVSRPSEATLVADTMIADESGKFSLGPHVDALDQDVAMRVKALHTAMANAKFQMCSERLNSVVMPHENGSDWWVYLMSASTKQEQAWIGGHARVHVSADGEKVLAVEPSTKACLSINPQELRAAGPRSSSPITQLLTDVPSEYHVMQSLTYAVPIMVVTRAGVWRVSGDKIEKMSLQVPKQ